MASKRAATTALSSISGSTLRRPQPVSRLAVRTQSTLAASSHSVRPVSLRAQRGCCKFTVPSSVARPAQFFSTSPRLRKEATDQQQSQNGKEILFKQYKFEDISSLPPSSTSSPGSSPLLIDVREPAELSATGIIPTAVPIPVGSHPDALFLDEDEFLTQFGFSKPSLVSEGTEADEAATTGSDMVFYCKAGVRARAAAQLAAQAGYDPQRIGVYEGSWLDWQKNGGKVEQWEGDE